MYDAGSDLMDRMMYSRLWSEWSACRYGQNDDEQLMIGLRHYVDADWRGARDKCWCDVTVMKMCWDSELKL